MQTGDDLGSAAHNTAIYFHPEAYTTSGPKLMGRNAAGESFLRGLLTHGRQEVFWLQVSQRDHALPFAQAARAAGRTEAVRIVEHRSLQMLEQAGVVYHPGPGIGGHAWQRAAYGHSAWALCGITHTTSSARVMDGITELLTAPVQPWDAVICTSTAVKDNVSRMLQAQAEHLRERLGAQRFVLPQLPVIPLGIHARDFAFTPQQRAQARQAWAADEHTHVVLFMGRLSFHAKAHPLAMYQALEAAAKQLPAGQRVLLVECGWHANAAIAQAFAQAAALACPSVQVITLDGRQPEARQAAWAGADVFCSLSDNIQETFGLTPVEAMAAGLPLVVSDWDGYRDTVRDGVDGFRIPTLMPSGGLGADLAARHALEIDSYDTYCGLACALVSVDIDTAAAALSRLMQDPALRRAMGTAARQRACEHYDWQAIIPRYEALWAQQNEQRQAQPGRQARPSHPWPARMDPFHAFAAYPSSTLLPQTRFVLTDIDASSAMARLKRYTALAMVAYARPILPEDAELQALLARAAQGPCTAADLVACLPLPRRALALRALVWLSKLGLIKPDVA